LQPRASLFWDMAAWHMAWNASVAAMNDRTQPRLALRIKAQREYFALGKDFLEHGIKNNPERPQLYESLARLYKEKYQDHARASASARTLFAWATWSVTTPTRMSASSTCAKWTAPSSRATTTSRRRLLNRHAISTNWPNKQSPGRGTI